MGNRGRSLFFWGLIWTVFFEPCSAARRVDHTRGRRMRPSAGSGSGSGSVRALKRLAARPATALLNQVVVGNWEQSERCCLISLCIGINWTATLSWDGALADALTGTPVDKITHCRSDAEQNAVASSEGCSFGWCLRCLIAFLTLTVFVSSFFPCVTGATGLKTKLVIAMRMGCAFLFNSDLLCKFIYCRIYSCNATASF